MDAVVDHQPLTDRQLLKALRSFRKGDFTARLPTDLTGVDGDIAEAFNDVVELNQELVKELSRLSTSVGKEGKISQRAKLSDAKGGWQTCIDAVNSLISDMGYPTAEVARVIGAVAKGDLSQAMILDIDGRPLRGEFLRIGKIVNTMVGQLGSFASEVSRVAREVGTEGKLGGQADVQGVAGTWKDLTDNVNLMATNLTGQVRNIAEVTTAVANGDLSKKITVDVKGEILELKDTINTMVDQLSSFASEVTRVAREVGTEGKLGGQAAVGGVAGTWKDLTDNVNMMATNLTSQVRNIAEVTTAVANGDLSKKITVDVKGEILELKDTINTMVDQLSSFASEVSRVAREVGTEGELGGQAEVKGVAGTWKDLTDNVNAMATNLTGQVRNIAEVTTAVANGDLSKKITVDVKGEILELKDTINTMVDQLSSFASEVSRVAREVGTEGKLGGQAAVEGVAGTWKDLTDNVNAMATNLTGQVRNIAEVTTAVANGDLSKKITVDVKGEILELKDTINTMVDQLSSFASEVSRVAREVGTDGKLGGQAAVGGVAGTWKDLTDNVNAMATNLTSQVRNIAEVTTAVARGDLSKKITVDVKGEILELKDTINTMVDQLSSFASEVSRVAREVGTDGKLGGQAAVGGVAGTWKDLTDNVNAMATNLTGQVRNIAEVTTAVANGDLSKKITVDVKGEILELKDTINTMVDQLSSFASEVSRVAREVGTEGELGGQAEVKGVAGTWKDLTDNVNAMATNLTSQVRNIAEVTTAVARGDLSKKITVDVQGEILELKDTINTMVDQLNSFASEVTRVAREVGTEGKLGGQAEVKGVAGTWKDLTDNVNMMATNLTNQVRGIADVVTAVAKGDLTGKLTVDAKGEIAALAGTINGMIVTLATFGDQVTNVAREVGIEGKLGGQARVPGAAGLWRDLTDNVNQLAANLTTQVRAIAEVATAVTTGDLTRSITVEASGEVAALKDNINEMIRNLEDTTLKNTEQDWLKTNLARFTRRLQGERDLVMVSNLVLSELAPLVGAQQGVFYMARLEEEKDEQEETVLELLASYAYKERKSLSNRYHLREGLVGQCAFEKQRILLTDVPTNYVQINSGLGEATPLNVVVLPVLFEGDVQAVLELASFNRFNETHLSFLDQLMESIGIVLNTIATNMRTEDLLKQSQRLTTELQSQQEELRNTNDRLEQQATTLRQSEELLKTQREELRAKNDELQEKAQLLAVEKRQVEATNMEVERAKQAVEEKAEQLALTSRYKSEFLANMSHELRTPLNSMLVLSKLLADNSDGNLSDKQVEFAHTVYSSGNDLLSLINEILDLSKIESGAMGVEIREMRFDLLEEHLRRTFTPVATEKKLSFVIDFHKSLPPQIYTDAMRLQQVLFNLLSNAFKFTETGGVAIKVRIVTTGWSRDHPVLTVANHVIGFTITDTGIGVSEDHQKIIFEAFQQGDGSTSRKYGGTGLGLSICREIAKLLGAEIKVDSTPGRGSSFTLYLPMDTEVVEPQDKPAIAAGQTVSDNIVASALPGTARPRSATDDRRQLDGSVPAMLIVEEDVEYANLLLDIVRSAGMKGVVASRGRDALAMARELRIDAVSFDLDLPDMDGWALLDRLKHEDATRHIPVHIISAPEHRRRGLDMTAFGFTSKPAEREILAASFRRLRDFVARPDRRLLVVGSSGDLGLGDLLGGPPGVTVQTAKRGSALQALEAAAFDCVVLDLTTAPAQAIKLLGELKNADLPENLPVLVYVPDKLSEKSAATLRQPMPWVTRRVVTDHDALVDEAAVWLHLPTSVLPAEGQNAVERASRADAALAGARVVIIDDDIRNIFSLTSVLERHQVSVLHAEDGRSGIELVRKTEDLDIVLVDIMMPEIDGYETIRRIRALGGAVGRLPLIAVTAKAMTDDRKKCLDAGASDYLSKPVDPEQLISTIRTWLYRTQDSVEKVADTPVAPDQRGRQ
ncbi:HAMP domain-containing protein [Thalassobaculum sp.]|uniref:HAMP domain-containing protein n=1 Tax=Thalassobaculum sp. TaxID=2022740 RepID=UPI0032EB714C